MTDILFPPGLCPRRITWTLERAVATYESPLSFASQRVARTGARWRASIEMPPLDQTETGLLSSWLNQISRAENCGIVPVFQNAGEYQTLTDAAFADLQPEWTEPNAFAGWTQNSTENTPSLSGRDLLVYSTSGTTSGNLARYSRQFTVTSGLPYLVTVTIPDQWSPGGYVISDAVSVTLVNARTPIPAAGQYRHLVYTTTGLIQVLLYPGNGEGAFVKSRYRRVSVARCHIAQGAVAAGARSMTLYGGRQAVGFNRTHQAGQFINLETASGWQLVQLVGDVEQISANTINGVNVTHHGRAIFEPPLRAAMVNMAGSQHLQPTCRMRLAEPNSSATIDAPMFGGFAFDMVEWLGA